MIKDILSIRLIKLNMIDKSNALENNEDELTFMVGVKCDINNLSKYNNENIYTVKSSLHLSIIPEDDTLSEVEKKDSIITSASFYNEMTFETVEEKIEIDDELKIEIVKSLEPYYRELINNIYSRTEITVPMLPYGFLISKVVE